MVLSLRSSVTCKLLFIVQLSFIASFLFSSVFADNEDVVYYHGSIITGVGFGNAVSVAIVIDGDMYAKPYTETNDSILVGFLNPNITILSGQNEALNYSECKSFQEYRDSILQPIVLKNNPDGTFKHILVNKDEHLTSSNLKLHYATLLQNQVLKLIQENKDFSFPSKVFKHMVVNGDENFTTTYLNLLFAVLLQNRIVIIDPKINFFQFSTKEPSLYGMCDAIYSVNKFQSNWDTMEITKVYNVKSCSKLKHTPVKNIYDYCRPKPKEDRKGNIVSTLTVKQEGVDSMFSLEDISFKPFKGEKKRLKITSLAWAIKLDTPFDTPIPEFDESNAKILTRKHITPVDETLLNDGNTENQEFINLYKGLSCFKGGQSIYMDLIRRFLQCNS